MRLLNNMYHQAVLTQEVLTYLDPKPHSLYLDATFGGGTHTKSILVHQPTCTVIGMDWDKTALETNAAPLIEQFGKRFIPLWGSFSHAILLLKKKGIRQLDGILADFGTSQYQISNQPGFSFASDTPLDMRMSTSHYRYTAADIVNRSSEKELTYILSTYGQEPASRKIAQLICAQRRKKPIRTTGQLVALIKQVKKQGKSRIHPATLTFQALRIAVNHELENIHALLQQSLTLLKAEGRLVCISFHSLEDGIVKHFMKEHQREFQILTPRVVMATLEERRRNPSSRSARLRAAQRLNGLTE